MSIGLWSYMDEKCRVASVEWQGGGMSTGKTKAMNGDLLKTGFRGLTKSLEKPPKAQNVILITTCQWTAVIPCEKELKLISIRIRI